MVHTLILDFLLWYLFVPIAIENMGDGFTFIQKDHLFTYFEDRHEALLWPYK